MTTSTAPFEGRRIHVAAGALIDGRGRVLVSKRADQAHQGGLWEFPGGKLEPGETAKQALRRELREELGVELTSFRPLIRVHHDYGDRLVVLEVFRVDGYKGKPAGREGQPLDWLAPDAMDPRVFPAADLPIINALRLPVGYAITGADPADEARFLQRLALTVEGDIGIVQLRAHGLPDADYARLAERAYKVCRTAGVRMLLNRALPVAAGLAGDGVHLTSRALRELAACPTRPPGVLGASCHDAEELALAGQLGLDYALLSPVYETSTHPGAAPLGWSGFAALADIAALPVYALGGLGPGDVLTCIANGGQGIAGIGAFWREDA